MAPLHRDSHADLLPTSFRLGSSRPVDTIVVPAGRPDVTGLEFAASLADDLGCLLLLLCSEGGVRPDEFANFAGPRWPVLRWAWIFVPVDYKHPMLPPTAWPGAHHRSAHHGPLSAKRNIALLMARKLAWRTLLFLDDDIYGASPRLVQRAASGLDRYAAVALLVDDYPDHSLVCHANLLGIDDKKVFVGASALVVDCSRRVDYFPNIYNEDWLFLHQGLSDGVVNRVPKVRQRVPSPFDGPARAAAEEFGDVVAEGVMAALHEGLDVRAIKETDFWGSFLRSRASFIERATRHVETVTLSDEEERRDALAWLGAAETARSKLTKQECADFAVAWLRDRARWRTTWSLIGASGGFDAAVASLKLIGRLSDPAVASAGS